MVDKRGFLVSRSHTIAVQMMHRTGEVPLPLLIWRRTQNGLWHSSFLTGLYDFYEDKENNLFVLSMPLGKKQASMILIMPYHLEPLERLEKVLSRKQLDTWISKMENKAVAISMPKVSVDVSHNLQVNGFEEEEGEKKQLPFV